MIRRPRFALLAAVVGLVALVVTGLAAFLSPGADAHDNASLAAFGTLNRTPLTQVADHLAHLVDPSRFMLLGLVLIAVGLIRRRPRSAAAVPLIMAGATASSETLKHLLSHPRPSSSAFVANVAAASWPSGHATAAMAVALCAVLVAPRRLRPAVATLGALLAVGVSYSVLVLGWHFPSDVLGGFLVAGVWTALAIGGLGWAEQRWPPRGRRPVAVRASDLLLPAGLGALTLGGLIGIVAMRPGGMVSFVAGHGSFLAAVLTIAALAATLPSAAALALRR